VRPRRPSGVIARPLNFPVRSHFREIQRREEQGAGSIDDVAVWALANSVVLQASSFNAVECACGGAAAKVGARAQAVRRAHQSRLLRYAPGAHRSG
jgi:hypothetical protein